MLFRSMQPQPKEFIRAIADQLASEGFIGVLPDLTSGLGPNGGNHDSYRNRLTGVAQAVPRHREINEMLARHILKKLAK